MWLDFKGHNLSIQDVSLVTNLSILPSPRSCCCHLQSTRLPLKSKWLRPYPISLFCFTSPLTYTIIIYFLYKLLNTVKLLKYFCRLSPPHPVKEDTELFNTRMYGTPTRVLRFDCTKVTKPAIYLLLLPPAPIVSIVYSYPCHSASGVVMVLMISTVTQLLFQPVTIHQSVSLS